MQVFYMLCNSYSTGSAVSCGTARTGYYNNLLLICGEHRRNTGS